jgi:phosphohistidine phosphatase
MRRLYLLRHVKSSWKHPELDDHERPLAGRGRRAGKALARHLREQRVEPQLVLCSPALRARQTLELIEPALGARSVEVERELYAATAATLLEHLRAVRRSVTSVMLIGHNPGLQDLAVGLAGDAPGAAELATKLPTGALVTFEVVGSGWRELGPATARLTAFVRPRDLER